MTTLAVTAIGTDRPGIVAAVTGALVEHGCNLEDTSMSILRGHFAMVLIVDAPDALEAASLEAAIVATSATDDLVVAVRTVHAGAGGAPAAWAPEGERWTVVVYGADHPGIVHGIATALADLDVNIVDLTTRVTGEDKPIYAMVMEVALSGRITGAELDARLAATASGLGVECTLHPSEADIL
jgi:glycine cleavage system transcriptional repressor